MSDQVLVAEIALVGAFITALFTLAGVVIAARIRAAEAVLASQEKRIEGLEKEVSSFRSDNTKLTDYAHELRAHIDDEKPPPPPPWPTDLKR